MKISQIINPSCPSMETPEDFEPMGGIIGKWERVPIETFKPDPDEVIVFKFKTEPLNLDQMSQICNEIVNGFPNNTIVTIPDNSCLEMFPKDQLVEVLQNVIKQLEES